ncbi:MAG: YbaN family protein [Alistipes sp.]|nr:YbaN family protein [Alistipes sp.]
MRTIYIVLGGVAVGLGVMGIFLPVLPTTPFLLLAAALWCKGSPRLYRWLLDNKLLGEYIRNFREHRAIPLRAKIASVAVLWATILLSAFLAVEAWWLRGVLLAVAVGVTWHILSFATLKKRGGDAEKR